MNKFLVALLLFSLFYTEDVSAQEKLIVKAKDDYAPFSYVNKLGYNSGFTLDIVKYILNANDIQYTLSLESDRKSIKQQLNAGTIDVSPGMFDSQGNRDSMLLTKPIFYSTLAIVSNNASPYFSVRELKGKRLLVSETDWTYNTVSNLHLSDEITTIYTIQEGIDSLKSGKYDAMLFAEQTILYYISRHKIKGLVVEPAEAPQQAICIGISKEHPELLELFDSSINEMKTSGAYSEIFDNWFGVYDNKYMTDLYMLIILGIILIAFIVMSFFAVSNRKIHKARLYAENSDRMKSMFLANISHDIRTPLNSIVGFSQLICEGGLEKCEMDKFASIIRESNENLLHMVEEVLDLCNIESGQMNYKPHKVDVARFFSELEKSFLPMMTNPEVELIVDSPYSSYIAFLDERRLKQVLTNFFINAVQFTHKGSITIGYNMNKDEITIYVTDTGIGIAEKDQRNIFDRFYKVDPVNDGHGLGLSINKAIMTALHGKIGVSSVLGQGSTFWASSKLRREGADMDF